MTAWSEILGWREEQFSELRILGYSYLKQGQYAKAALFFEALLLLQPENAYDMQTLGALYLEMGETEKALVLLDKALLLAPDHSLTRLNRAKALLSLRKRDEARVVLTQLVSAPEPAISGDAEALLMTM